MHVCPCGFLRSRRLLNILYFSSGYRFAQIEMKVLLATLLLRFRFSLTDDVIVWNLSQIISPSVATKEEEGKVVERKGMPLKVEVL